LKPLRVAVVGAGWAGIAAAVHARLAGHDVHLFEMAPKAGGRARGVPVDGLMLDNGQHILIGAYTATLELMSAVGLDPQAVLQRLPLALQYPDGRGLRLRGAAPVPAFIRAVLAHQGWSWPGRLSLLLRAARWAAAGFNASPAQSVADLCAGLPPPVQRQLIEPLCVAALNTPSAQASAEVFLRVLRDALFGGPGSSDLLLPKASLSALLPDPATVWFEAHGVRLVTGARVRQLRRDAAGWQVDDAAFDAVVLACSAVEAARLCAPVVSDWARQTAALQYEPIVTVYLRSPGMRLPLPMLALESGQDAPAQFVFDLGALGQAEGVLAFVISGARDWVERGLQATADATLAQARATWTAERGVAPPSLLHVAAEKRATFRCTPGLQRPPGRIAPGLLAAGDYVAGPYPATLEGAVRSGREAAASLCELASAC
jgi:squalene-associated FAD-dependent desaturase